jgi:hypothetical protein
MTRIKTRYVVRNARGEELVVPSLDDLRALYAQGFLDDADDVRQERSEEWLQVGQFSALHGLREVRRESPARVGAIALALLLLATALGIMFAHSR